MSRTGLPSLALSGFLFGTGGLLGSLLGRAASLAPLAVATYRLAIGGALIIVFLAITGKSLPRGRAAARRIGQLAVLAAGCQGCYFTSVSLSSVTLATLITIGTIPVLVLIAERVTGRRMITAVALAVAGLGLLVGLPTGSVGAGAMLASAAFAVLSAAGFAAMTLLGARPVPGVDPLTASGFGFAAGGLLLAPLAELTVGLSFRPSTAGIGLLIALAVGPTAVAYPLFFHGLRTVPATTGAILLLLEPLTGSTLAALLLGDRLGPVGLVGAGLLCVAMVLATRSSLRVNPEQDSGKAPDHSGPRLPESWLDTTTGQFCGRNSDG